VATGPNERLIFFDELVATEIALWAALDDAVLKATGVNLGLITAIRQISRADAGMRIQELADGIGITVGAASKIGDRLVRAGLATRLPNPTDGRSSLLTPTPAGTQALESGLNAMRKELMVRTGALGPEELRTITEHLGSIRRVFTSTDETFAN
jgi:DNA-binding MarR family transcriptional regulator